MLAGLALVAQVHRHLPFVVGVVLGHTDSFGVHSFGKLVLLVGSLFGGIGIWDRLPLRVGSCYSNCLVGRDV